MEYFIRPIQPEDARQAAVLSEQLGYPIAEQEIRAHIQQMLESDKEIAWVAENKGELLGWIQATKMLRIMSGEFGEITGLVVASHLRGKGIGRMLVSEALLWSQKENFSRLIVRTNVVREAAPAFYTRLGFKERKRQAVLAFELE